MSFENTVTSNFSFSHSIFYPLENFSPFPTNVKVSSATLLIWESLKFIIWERVKTKRQNLDNSKSRALKDDKINVNENLKCVLKRVKTLWEKEKNAGYQHFLLFPHCFKNVSARVMKKSN